jgi:hypothetical protein
VQISDRIRVSDLKAAVSSSNMERENQDILLMLLGRVDMFIQDLILQLKNQPTIYTVNPATDPDAVEGAKTGDIAVFENQYGDVEIVRFK